MNKMFLLKQMPIYLNLPGIIRDCFKLSVSGVIAVFSNKSKLVRATC